MLRYWKHRKTGEIWAVNEEDELAFQVEDEGEIGQISPDDPKFDPHEYTWLLGEEKYLIELGGEEDEEI